MKIKFVLAISLILAASCASAGRGDPVVIGVKKTAASIIVEINVNDGESLTIYNGKVLAAMPDDPGVVLKVKDARGNLIGRCATIRPAYAPDKFNAAVVSAGKPLVFEFDFLSLSRQFCLIPGSYFLSVMLRQPGGDYHSKWIGFDVEDRDTHK